MTGRMAEPGKFDAIIVGAGVGGLYAIHRLRKLGLKVRAFEAAAGVGGTWYWNRYPGCRCDVESFDYSAPWDPQLDQDWDWSERYALQPELLRYLSHIADRHDLRTDIKFNTAAERMTWDEARKLFRWCQPLMKLDTNVKFVQYIKLAVQEAGLGAEWVREPRLPLSGAEREEILGIIRQGLSARPGG